MRISVISYTKNGIDTSLRLSALDYFKDKEVRLFTKCSTCADVEGVKYVEESISKWTGEQFEIFDALISIGAMGIAVRSIAPFVNDKLKDIPVLVMDEKGMYVIPVLSGHMGGANEIAISIANELGAQAVITTATDINKVFAVDLWAKKNNLFICNKEGIKKVSSKVLAGEKIKVSMVKEDIKDLSLAPDCIDIVDYPPTEEVDVLVTDDEDMGPADLVLKKRKYVLGIGCKKNKSFEDVLGVLNFALGEARIDVGDIGFIASIDIKKDEEALIKLSDFLQAPFKTFSADVLRGVEGDYTKSDYVKEVTGVDNVCERAAMAAGLELCKDAELVFSKYAMDGVTIALAKAEWKIEFYE